MSGNIPGLVSRVMLPRMARAPFTCLLCFELAHESRNHNTVMLACGPPRNAAIGFKATHL
jgi:hypothetical protein